MRSLVPGSILLWEKTPEAVRNSNSRPLSHVLTRPSLILDLGSSVK